MNFLQIETDDGMPDKLCKECTEKAYLAYNFKVTLEQNDSTLRSVLFKDQIDGMKRDAVFDETNTYLGIKTEIAFVDADPFIDDDGDFDYVHATTENSSASNHHQQIDNNNSYEQCDEEEILQSEGNECEEEEIEEIEEENEEEIEEGIDESFEMTSPKDKVKKRSPAVENVDYVKDEEGKFVCQICNKKLTDKKGLNLHLRLHTGKNLKRCNICNRGE